jgi:Methyltransferase domain
MIIWSSLAEQSENSGLSHLGFQPVQKTPTIHVSSGFIWGIPDYMNIFRHKRYQLMKWLSPFIAPLPLHLSMVLRVSGSDKENPGGHHYGSTYHQIFRGMKYRRLTLLEIGIGGNDRYLGGESLGAWRCYFPFGNIIGCDIEDKRQLAGGRVRVHVIDQSSASDLSRLASQEGPFDIIIGDGSHVNAHQIFSFKNLFAHLKDRGIYVVEDTQTSYWPEFGGKPVNQQTLTTTMGYFTELAKYLNYPEFRTEGDVDADMINLAKTIRSISFEHNLIIVHKHSRTAFANSLKCPKYRPETIITRSAP